MIINISAKCSDLFSAVLCRRDSDGNLTRIAEYDGYVPEWLPSTNVQHYGDYVQLDIDVETGRILNWKKPTNKDLKETFNYDARRQSA